MINSGANVYSTARNAFTPIHMGPSQAILARDDIKIDEDITETKKKRTEELIPGLSWNIVE